MSNEQNLREALRIAVNYIDMDALYTVAGGDYDTIKEALATTEPDMPLSMNQFGRLVELTREHLSDNTFVYKATSKTGDTCHFGVESAAKAWAKGGTVEAIKVRDFKLISPTSKQPLQVEPAVNQQLTTEPVDEREAFEREMSKPPFEFCMDRWPDDGAYAWPGNYAAYHTQCAWVAWQARAAMAQGVKG